MQPKSYSRVTDCSLKCFVIIPAQDLDSRVVAWKGGAVLACLDTTQELWIHQREWQRFGVRMLRERAGFVW